MPVLEKHQFAFRILDVMESWKCRLYFSVYGIKKNDLIEGAENGYQLPVLHIQHMQEIKNYVFQTILNRASPVTQR